MTSSTEQLDVLRDLVEAQEEELHLAVEELEVAARRAIDARHWIRSRPFVWTGGAFLIGAWLGGRPR